MDLILLGILGVTDCVADVLGGIPGLRQVTRKAAGHHEIQNDQHDRNGEHVFEPSTRFSADDSVPDLRNTATRFLVGMERIELSSAAYQADALTIVLHTYKLVSPRGFEPLLSH